MTKKIYLFWIVSVFNLTIFGQIGFLGKLNSIEINSQLSPSSLRSNSMEINGSDTLMTQTKRFLKANYSVNFTHVSSKKVELGFGAQFSRMLSFNNTYSEYYNGDNVERGILNDLVLYQGGLNFDFRRYFNGSIAPVGRYFGISSGLNLTQLKSNQQYVTGNFNVDENFKGFRQTYETKNVIYSDEASSTKKMVVFGINMSIGRNWIVSDKIMINCSVIVPLLAVMAYDNNMWLHYTSLRPIYQSDDEDDALIAIFHNTMNNYDKVRYQFGMKFLL
jgi:hypothetical protein